MTKFKNKTAIAETKPTLTKKPLKIITHTEIANVAEPTPEKKESKQAILINLLQSPTGATVHELAAATNWQKHSVHGVMSGVLKKKLGLAITSSTEERGLVYRIIKGE